MSGMPCLSMQQAQRPLFDLMPIASSLEEKKLLSSYYFSSTCMYKITKPYIEGASLYCLLVYSTVYVKSSEGKAVFLLSVPGVGWRWGDGAKPTHSSPSPISQHGHALSSTQGEKDSERGMEGAVIGKKEWASSSLFHLGKFHGNRSI